MIPHSRCCIQAADHVAVGLQADATKAGLPAGISASDRRVPRFSTFSQLPDDIYLEGFCFVVDSYSNAQITNYCGLWTASSCRCTPGHLVYVMPLRRLAQPQPPPEQLLHMVLEVEHTPQETRLRMLNEATVRILTTEAVCQ